VRVSEQFFRDWRVVLYESNSHASTGRQVQRLCELPAMNSKSSGESSSGSGRLSSRQVGDAKHPNTEDAALPLMEPLNRVFCLAGQAGASKGSHGDKSELRLVRFGYCRKEDEKERKENEVEEEDEVLEHNEECVHTTLKEKFEQVILKQSPIFFSLRLSLRQALWLYHI